MTRLALAALVIVLAAAPAFAEAPTGFRDFKWGTAPAVIREQFIATRCRSFTESRRVWYTLMCRDYNVEGLVVPVVRLDFEPAESLAGYTMTVARASYPAFRDLLVQRFGRPTSRSSFLWPRGQMSWTWSGVTAILLERCGEEASCVEVTTTAIERKREEIRERERRDSVQSF